MQQAAPAMPPFGDLMARARFAKTVFAAQYPATFSDDPKPLKIGIHNDLKTRHPEFSMPEIRRALSWLCHSHRYLRTFKPGSIRLDLDGNPAGEVTAEQAEIARQRIAAMKADADKKRKATAAEVTAKTPRKAAKSTAKATPPPPPPTLPGAIPGRPVLKLNPKASTVVTAAVTRREVRP